MSFASKNPFAALGDEDSDSAPAPVKAPAAAKEAPKAPRREIPGLSSNRAPRGGAEEADAPAQRDGRGGRGGRGRGGRPDNGARGGRGANRGRARHGGLDRHSGTGKEDSAKRIEQGWGGDDPKRELDAENKAVTDATEEKSGDAAAPAPAAPETNGAAPTEPEEEKDNTKTLDEYLADLAAKRAQIGAKKEARAAETATNDLGTKFEKPAEESYYAAKGERTTRQRERKEKQILEIDQTFNQPASAPRGGRGGRGGPRGGRGGSRGGFTGERGGERGGRGRGGRGRGGANINLSDSNAFPTLG